MKVAIIDYGMSNLGSVRRAFEECGAEVSLCATPSDWDGEYRIVLPGVGAFADGIKNLQERGWAEQLPALLKDPEVALLGICLGMQLLADEGTEGGVHPGLGLLRGRILKLAATDASERIPHVGWNEIQPTRPSPLLTGIASGTDYYFVHSYHFAEAGDASIATTPYAGGFTSMVAAGNVFGAQFHPEKSSRPGFALIRNFLCPSLCHA